MPIIYDEFTLEERSEFAFPIYALEDVMKLGEEGFKNAKIRSKSGTEDVTQKDTREIEDERAKRKARMPDDIDFVMKRKPRKRQ